MDKEAYLKITRPQNTCVLCGTPLAEQGKHPSALVAPPSGSDDEDEIPQRRDYCPACWERQSASTYLGFWMARRDPPKPRKVQNRKERNARLAAYFDYFYQDNATAHAGRLCFLAHLLIRYQVFKWLRTDPPVAEGRGERIVCRNSITDEEIVVEMVPLADAELTAIKKEVDDLLAGVLAPSATNGDAPQSPSDVVAGPDIDAGAF